MVRASRLVVAATASLAAYSSTSSRRCHAFGNNNGVIVGRVVARSSSPSSSTMSSTSDEDDGDSSARAMSEYMARSHEEKLRAIRDVEMKKNAVIEALRAEIDALKSSSALAVISPTPTTSVVTNVAKDDNAEIQMKLASYQNFMANYIVNAQNQKLLAVKEAELKAEKKFQERLERLMTSGGMMMMQASADASSSTADATVTMTATADTPYQKRNAGILSAASAGKSRWGKMEIDRAAASMAQQQQQPQRSLTPPATAAGPPAVAVTAYDMRNARVIASAGAGMSRWGVMEVERAMNASPPSSTVETTTPIVGVDGRSVGLEERLNLGARLLGGGSPAAPVVASAPSTAFDMRNARVVASAGAGRSRWGTMEVERIATMGKQHSSVPTAVTNSPPAPAEKRSVSMEDRVNLGARLLGVQSEV